MADLSGQTIASSYEQLLSLPDGGGNANTLVAVTDGDGGTTFGIKLATNKVEILPSAADDAAAFEVSKNDGTPVFTVNTSTAGASVAGTLTASGQTFIGGTTDEGYSTLLNIEGAGGTDDVVGILFKNTSASNDEEIMSLLASQGSDSVGAINIKREGNADDAYIDFLTQANGGSMTERMRINSSGEVQVKGASGGNLRIVRDDTTTTSGETLGRLLFSSTDGGIDTVDASAVIEAIATEDFGTGNKGAKLQFSTKPSGDDVDHNDHLALTIDQDQSSTFSAPVLCIHNNDAPLTFKKTTNGEMFIKYLDQNAALKGAIIYRTDSNQFSIRTNNSTALDIDSSQKFTFAGQAKFAEGSASTPSISFSTDDDTGLYNGGTGAITFVSQTNRVLELQSSLLAEFSGDIRLNGDDTKIQFNTSGASGHPALSMDSNAAFNFLNTSGGTSVQIANNGDTGIRATSPSANLDVRGDSSKPIVNFGDADARDADAVDIFGSGSFRYQFQNGTTFRPAIIEGGGDVGTNETAVYFTGFSSNADNGHRNLGGMSVFRKGTSTGGKEGSQLRFRTKTDNVSTPADNMVLDENGQLGIGVTNLGARLHVRTDTAGSLCKTRIDGDNGSSDGGAVLALAYNTTEKWNILTRNQTSVGSAFSLQILDDDGNDGVFLNQDATSFSANSDERMKENIVELESATDKLNTLRCVNFNMKHDSSEKKRIGLIAQDVYKVYPEATTGTPDSEYSYNPSNEGSSHINAMAVQYTELIAPMIKAIQELSAKVEELENKLGD